MRWRARRSAQPLGGTVPFRTQSDLDEYTASLFERRGEAVCLKRLKVSVGDWHPRARDCHGNVQSFCKHSPEFVPVRGWAYFDFNRQRDYVKFAVHSVVMCPDGSMADITPSDFSGTLLFLPSGLDASSYFDLIEKGRIIYIDFYFATRSAGAEVQSN
jgi:hypothetical protein